MYVVVLFLALIFKILTSGFADISQPKVTSDVNNAIVVWHQDDGTNLRINVAYTNDFGQTWSEPSRISNAGFDATTPIVQMKGSNAVAIWQNSDGTNDAIQVSNSTDYGVTWSAPQTISLDGSSGANVCMILQTNNNKVIAMWECTYNGQYQIDTAYSLDFGATWSTVNMLMVNAKEMHFPRMGVNDNGNAVAVWMRDTSTQYELIVAESSDGGVNWTVMPSKNIEGVYSPEVVIDNTDNVLISWSTLNNGPLGIVTCYFPFADYNSLVVNQIDTNPNACFSPKLVLFDSIKAAMVYFSQPPACQIVAEACANIAAPIWPLPINITNNVLNNLYPKLKNTSTGQLISVWQGFDGSDFRIKSSYSFDGGTSWSEPVDISELGKEGYSPDISTTQDRYAITAWQNYSNNSIQVASSSDSGVTWSAPITLSR
ncbi:MAG: exo-alpha-sialidase [Chlamydiae bacterium]|nr:exo-alpha-sialidase [Chlamydiota bacterium]